jgi:hypothetical protein
VEWGLTGPYGRDRDRLTVGKIRKAGDIPALMAEGIKQMAP